jgi:hypothetical protein
MYLRPVDWRPGSASSMIDLGVIGVLGVFLFILFVFILKYLS